MLMPVIFFWTDVHFDYVKFIQFTIINATFPQVDHNDVPFLS